MRWLLYLRGCSGCRCRCWCWCRNGSRSRSRSSRRLRRRRRWSDCEFVFAKVEFVVVVERHPSLPYTHAALARRERARARERRVPLAGSDAQLCPPRLTRIPGQKRQTSYHYHLLLASRIACWTRGAAPDSQLAPFASPGDNDLDLCTASQAPDRHRRKGVNMLPTSRNGSRPLNGSVASLSLPAPDLVRTEPDSRLHSTADTVD